MHDTRLKILTIIILSIGLSLSKNSDIVIVIMITIIYSYFYKSYILKSIPVLLSTLVFIFTIGLFTFIISSVSNFDEIILGSIRWISLILLTFIIFSSLNLFEFLAALIFFKVNAKIAIAFGVGLRFLPIIIEEGKRVAFMQKRNGLITKNNPLRSFNLLLSPFIISIIRRIDTITISIITQQIETRIEKYKFDKVVFKDWIIFSFSVVFLIAISLQIQWNMVL